MFVSCLVRACFSYVVIYFKIIIIIIIETCINFCNVAVRQRSIVRVFFFGLLAVVLLDMELLVDDHYDASRSKHSLLADGWQIGTPHDVPEEVHKLKNPALRVSAMVGQIHKIDSQAGTFSASVRFRFSYDLEVKKEQSDPAGPSLYLPTAAPAAGAPGASPRISAPAAARAAAPAASDEHEVWRPSIRIDNPGEMHNVQVQRSQAKVKTNHAGTQVVHWHEDYDGVFVESMELEDFPFDCQPLRIILTLKSAKDACIVVPHENELQPVLHRPWVGHSEWDLLQPALFVDYVSKTHNITGATQTRTRITLAMGVQRASSYFVINIMGLMGTLCAASFTAFFMPPDDLNARATFVVTLLLTLVAVKLLVSERLPQIAYVTLLDRYALTMIASMFCEMVIFAALSQLDDPIASTWWDTATYRIAALVFLGGHAAFAWVIRSVWMRNRQRYPPVILRAGSCFPTESPHTNENHEG